MRSVISSLKSHVSSLTFLVLVVLAVVLNPVARRKKMKGTRTYSRLLTLPTI